MSRQSFVCQFAGYIASDQFSPGFWLFMKHSHNCHVIPFSLNQRLGRLRHWVAMYVCLLACLSVCLWQFKTHTLRFPGDLCLKGVSLISACNDTIVFLFSYWDDFFAIFFWSQPTVSQLTVDNEGVSRGSVCVCGCCQQALQNIHYLISCDMNLYNTFSYTYL